MTIVTIRPDDVVGVQESTLEWLFRYGIPAPFLHELVIDTVRMKATAHMLAGRIDEKAEEVIIYYDEARGEDGKPTKVPRKEPPYHFPIKDVPPGLERALRENVKSVTMPDGTTINFPKPPPPPTTPILRTPHP